MREGPFSVAELMAVHAAYPGLEPSAVAMAMTLARECADDPDLLPWVVRLTRLLDGDDYDEVDRLGLLAEQWQQSPAPLLFDGQPADLSDFDAPRPEWIECGEYRMRRPSVRTLIEAQTIDPTGGIGYTYAVLQRCLGLTRQEMNRMPQSAFHDLEIAVAFLARSTVTRILGS